MEHTQGQQEQDSEVLAHQLASKALQEEEKLRQEMRRKVDGKAKAKRDADSGKIVMEDGSLVKPMASFLQSAAVDFSHIPDECIKRNELGKFKVRWVRRLDEWGDPSDTEIGYHERFGFEPIYGKLKDKDGKRNPSLKTEENQFTRREFVAMQGPLDGFAALLAKSARPGSSVYDSAFEELEDMAERTNRKAGYRAVDVITSEHHGPEKPHQVSFNR